MIVSSDDFAPHYPNHLIPYSIELLATRQSHASPSAPTSICLLELPRQAPEALVERCERFYGSTALFAVGIALGEP